jgi:hypothetical protein
MYRFRLSRPASMYMLSFGLVGRGLRLQIPDVLPASVADTKYGNNSQYPALQKQQLKQPPLKMTAIDASKTSGSCNLRPWPTSPEDTIYEDYSAFFN